jgi:phosphoglycerate dehydrogenase-like enzyme
MNAKPTILAALTGPEWDTFFPPSLRRRLDELLPDMIVVDPESIDAAGWQALLARVQPEILLAAWKTPALPADWAALTGGRLRYVCYLAGSVRKLVTEQMVRDGLIVTNWGNSISRTVAECGLMLAIACLRRAHQWALDMHLRGAWKDASLVSNSLFERRVGIHGYGAISQELRKLLLPFDVPVTTYSPSVPDALLADHQVTRAPTLERLFTDNEVIFELAALTPSSHHMVREEHLRLIPPGGVFINIGRGAVVDEAALLRVARTTDLQIGLDVYAVEPLPANHPFRGERNIMLLPHLGGPTLDRRQDSGRLALRNLAAYCAGQQLDTVISAAVYARAT